MFLELAADLIKSHEGLKLRPYLCTAGRLTIGYGRNIEDNGISAREAEVMLDSDILETLTDLKSFKWWHALSDNRKAALVDFRFQMGASRFRLFKKTITALALGDFNIAADELLDSKYAKQCPNRAETISSLIRNG